MSDSSSEVRISEQTERKSNAFKAFTSVACHKLELHCSVIVWSPERLYLNQKPFFDPFLG